MKKKKKKGFSLISFFTESKVTFFLIGLNCAVFWYLTSNPKAEQWLNRLIVYPGNILNGNLYCLLTSAFIHKNLSHLLWNMLGLLVFGRVVERKVGSASTLLIYYGATFLSMLFSTVVYAFVLKENVAIIGASGAIMGLLSAAMLLDPFRITYEMILPIPVMVKGWMFIYADIQGFLGQENDGVSHLAHLFGYLSIAIIVYFLSSDERKMLKTGLMVNVLSFMAFLLIRNWLINYF